MTSTESGIDVAMRKGFHKMIANDMARECRAMLDALARQAVLFKN